MARQRKPFKLFVYGTLMSPSVFRAVLGRRMVTTAGDADGVESLYARDAVLDGYKKISPDNTYLYAVPEAGERIRGYLISPLPPECMAALLRYEGQNYSRRTLEVQTKDGLENATVFVGNLPQLQHTFGYAFHDPLKQEILLRRKIEAALLETEREQLHTEEHVARRALGELHGPTIRDLVRRHFEAGGISDYAIRHSIRDEPLRDFQTITADPEARALAPNYLALVVRQVVFNELEEKIRSDFRYELDRMDPGEGYYERAISSLVALRIVNRNAKALDELAREALTQLSFEKHHLVDFVRWAIAAADALYEPRSARRQVFLIRNHMGGGFVPLGTELEFSNIGHAVIRDPEGAAVRDRQYDGFLYFSDFGLDSLTWKLGGHVDDHREKSSAQRRRGFFEAALGNVSIEANLSKPITTDPWLLNRFIHETRRFYYSIVPHSVHVSLQLRRQQRPDRDRLMPLHVMKCLFAVAGDPVVGPDGRACIQRLVSDEIITVDQAPHMLFSEITKRHGAEADDVYATRSRGGGRYVQQFRFLRLSRGLNYEPIIMALKGLQLSLRQGNFLTASQYEASRKHRECFDELVAWGGDLRPIAAGEVRDFLRHVKEGLAREHRGKPAHSGAYIAWSLAELKQMLEKFNYFVTTSRRGRPSSAAGRKTG